LFTTPNRSISLAVVGEPVKISSIAWQGMSILLT
jgi:hypothetical protein